jgi:glutamyl-Q tRNA(Asp) synthetase
VSSPRGEQVVDTTRFAPSPTGYLHRGHAFAAWQAAEATQGGRFLVRIEDLDRGRARPEFESALLEDLAWLGLEWEQPVLRQSTRSDAYRSAVARLQAQELLYPCFCTRREIAAEIARAVEAPHGSQLGSNHREPNSDGLRYPGTCRHLSAAERQRRCAAGEPFALRLDAAAAVARLGPLSFQECGAGPDGEHGEIAVEAERFGDVVLARKDLPAAYHLAVVVDDAFQGVTLVTRGHDLFDATHIQRVLQALLELPVPRYAHHRLILEGDRKLSKRDGSTSLRSLRAAGIHPRQLRAELFCER